MYADALDLLTLLAATNALNLRVLKQFVAGPLRQLASNNAGIDDGSPLSIGMCSGKPISERNRQTPFQCAGAFIAESRFRFSSGLLPESAAVLLRGGGMWILGGR